MKTVITLFLISFISLNIFAQSGTMLPDGFIIPNSATAPTCTVADKGKMYYNTTTKAMMICNGTTWLPASSLWNDNQSLPNTINYSGNVGINTTTPQYELDVNGTIRVSGDLYSTKIGIGSTAIPSFALQVTDGDIAITSTADAKTWKFNYEDANNWLALQENGTTRMVIANGGNVGIGSTNPTAKLQVDGTGYFTGNLTVNSGKGIVRTTSANSMKLHTVAHSLGTSFTVNTGLCATSNVNITSAAYSAAPTAYVGNFVSGTGNFGQLIAQVQSTTATQVVVRFCNNTASNITLSNAIYNILVVGQ
ncbi:hypothetical protein [Emticicia sp. W12TSBA100-4]|uniref:hypothetical protein n=1 Tax=Emticicia sp. W12TSBA100-4 TaxID=3160965 RepID=UPI00330636BA